MTVDREQIRQRGVMIRHLCSKIGGIGWMAAQDAEQELDALVAELEQAEARLAREPALVEALREMLHRMETCDEPGCEAEEHITYEIRDALAAWDADQLGPDQTP